MGMTRLLAAAGILTAFLLLAEPGGATHQGTSHCIEDVTTDQVVDISDLVIFAGAFGDTGPAYLDVAPAMGDGIIDISDLTHVAGHFGQPCYGFTETSAVQLTQAATVSTCEMWVSGFVKGYDTGYALVHWGGKTSCESELPELYLTHCWFEIYADVNGNGQYEPGEFVASTIPRQSVPPNGLYCAANPSDNAAWLPMGVDLQGGLWHEIEREGLTVHGPSGHTNGYEFRVD